MLEDATNLDYFSNVISRESGVVRSVAFSSDGQTLAAGGSDQSVRVWDIASSQGRQTPQKLAHDGFVYSVFVQPRRTMARCGGA